MTDSEELKVVSCNICNMVLRTKIDAKMPVTEAEMVEIYMNIKDAFPFVITSYTPRHEGGTAEEWLNLFLCEKHYKLFKKDESAN